jgi:hypothetical protein
VCAHLVCVCARVCVHVHARVRMYMHARASRRLATSTPADGLWRSTIFCNTPCLVLPSDPCFPPPIHLSQGKVAKLLSIDNKNSVVVVEGVNMRTKNVKPMKEGETGQQMKKEYPIHISKVALADEQPAAAAAE